MARTTLYVAHVGHIRREDSSGALERLQRSEPLPDLALLQPIAHEQKEGEGGQHAELSWLAVPVVVSMPRCAREHGGLVPSIQSAVA